LIGSSLACVDGGMRLVGETDSAIADIVSSVRSVAQVIEGISSASLNQSEGIADIALSMGDLEDVTQHNAALIEESAAATSSLVDQVRLLTNAVSQFRVEPSLALRGVDRPLLVANA
ncbi:MAG: hypothetical protein HXX19_09190, partial [Rhodoferax sp.]|nr:hypothetical protein [Rhodoferax sp.]